MNFDERTRILALDIGHKRTGVALSDPSRMIASPFSTVESRQKDGWAKAIAALIDENEVVEVVVGIPFNQHGEEGEDARRIREFVTVLRARITVPVVEWDERFTTVQAERSLLTTDISRKRRREIIDQVAASIILQSYLDHLRYRTGE